ncbi:MAG: hypothetical protein HC861_05685 [Rhodospirillaceae bacterium]|nr:hypothetical protein [Rhodospirillaceae bacterium]
MRPSRWGWLAVAVAIVWTLLPIYWFLKLSLLTPAEIARFPPPLWPLDPHPAAFFNIFGFDYTLAMARCDAPPARPTRSFAACSTA